MVEGRRSAIPPGVEAKYGFPVDYYFYPDNKAYAGPIVRLVVREENGGLLAFITINAAGEVIERGRGLTQINESFLKEYLVVESFPWEDWVIGNCLKDHWSSKRPFVGRLFAAADGSCQGLIVEPAQ